MEVQDAVFRKIQNEMSSIGRGAATVKVAMYLEMLYSPDLDGDIAFYEQDQSGLPLKKIETTIAKNDPFYSTLLLRNVLIVSAWEDIDKPDNFDGGAWPPRTRANLLGCKTLEEVCAECDLESSANDTTRDDDYSLCVRRMLKFWHENMDIRLTEHTGYGLFARNPITARRFIGEYTGEVVPYNKELTDDETQYQFTINIGKLQESKKHMQPKCWVDATKQGSVFRFMAHSCEPNAAVTQARLGTHHRILLVYTIWPISRGESITIDYGHEWFTADKHPCYCGTPSCKNPPRYDDDLMDESSDGEHQFINDLDYDAVPDSGYTSAADNEYRSDINSQDESSSDSENEMGDDDDYNPGNDGEYESGSGIDTEYEMADQSEDEL